MKLAALTKPQRDALEILARSTSNRARIGLSTSKYGFVNCTACKSLVKLKLVEHTGVPGVVRLTLNGMALFTKMEIVPAPTREELTEAVNDWAERQTKQTKR